MAVVHSSTLLYVLGSIFLLNSIWMLLFPLHWYHNLPARVPEFGPFNHHFIRDVSIGFFLTAITSIAAARNKELRLPLAWSAMMFPVGHSLVHVIDCIAMNAGLDRWLIDLPPVHFVAVLYLAIVEAVSRPKNGFCCNFIIP